MTDLVDARKRQSDARGGTPSDAESIPGRGPTPRQLPAYVWPLFVFSLIAALYFWFIQHYSVNAIRDDQWIDITLIRKAFTGHLTLASLWAQHGENRILFQNLITLLLAYSTHFNVVVEEYLGGAMAVAATALFILAHHRRSPSTSWIFYVPVALVMLSFVQEGNMLFGFALGWYIVLLALAGAVYLLDRPALTWLALVGAIAITIIGSFSNLYGLLIWPAGLMLLFLRRRPRAFMFTWVASAVITAVVYFIDFDFQATRANNGYVLSHPATTVNYFFIALGDGLGIQWGSPFYWAVAGLGIVIFAVSCWVLITYSRSRDDSSGSPIGLVMICFGLLFCALMTIGRVWFGMPEAGWSRYTTYDLLVLVGCYVSVLNRPSQHAAPRVRRGTWNETARSGVIGLLTAAIGLQIVLGTANGISEARSWYASQQLAADIAVNVDKAPDYYLVLICTGCYLPVRQDVHFARAHRLSLFSTSVVQDDQRTGLPALSISTWVTRPVWGAELRGAQWLIASGYGASKLDFYVRGSTLHKALVFRAMRFPYGWLGAWNTTSVSNGTYTVRSIAYPVVGRAAWSSPIRVSVAN